MNTENTNKREIIEVEYEEHTENPSGLKEGLRKVRDFLMNNSFRTEKKGNEVLTIPVYVLVLGCILAGKILLPLMIVGLFFDFTYSFIGANNLESINEFLKKTSRVVKAIKLGFKQAL